MTELPNCLLIVTAEVDASVEADWNRWYDDVHLPDALACPGVRAGRRYVSSGEISESDRGQGRRTRTRLYTTVYELEFAGRGRNQGIQGHARLGSLCAPCPLPDASGGAGQVAAGRNRAARPRIIPACKSLMS